MGVEELEEKEGKLRPKLAPKTEAWIRDKVFGSGDWAFIPARVRNNYILALEETIAKNNLDYIYAIEKRNANAFEVLKRVQNAIVDTKPNAKGEYELSKNVRDSLLRDIVPFSPAIDEGEKKLARATPKRREELRRKEALEMDTLVRKHLGEEGAKETKALEKKLAKERVAAKKPKEIPKEAAREREEKEEALKLAENTAAWVKKVLVVKELASESESSKYIDLINRSLQSNPSEVFSRIKDENPQAYRFLSLLRDALGGVLPEDGKKLDLPHEERVAVMKKFNPPQAPEERGKRGGQEDAIAWAKTAAEKPAALTKEERDSIFSTLANAPAEAEAYSELVASEKGEASEKKSPLSPILDPIGNMIERAVEIATGRRRSSLTDKTEAWVKERVLMGKGEHEKKAYLDVLSSALRKRDSGIIGAQVQDGRVGSLLEKAYALLVQDAPTREGKYFMNESKIASFWKSTGSGGQGMMAAQGPSPSDEVSVFASSEDRLVQKPGLVRASFIDKSQARQADHKYYVKMAAGDTNYLVEFSNPAHIPEGSVLKGMEGSVTAIAINYGGSRAKVMKLDRNGAVAETYDMGDIPQAQKLSYEKANRVSVELLEAPIDTKASPKSRFEIILESGKFVIETPRLSEEELKITQNDFSRLSADEAIAKLLATAGAKLYGFDKERNMQEIKDIEFFLRRLRNEDRVAVEHYVLAEPFGNG